VFKEFNVSNFAGRITGTYAEREAAGGLWSHEIFDFAINGTA